VLGGYLSLFYKPLVPGIKTLEICFSFKKIQNQRTFNSSFFVSKNLKENLYFSPNNWQRTSRRLLDGSWIFLRAAILYQNHSSTIITYIKLCRGRNEAFHPSIFPFVSSSIHGWHHTGKKTLAEINNPPLCACVAV